MTIPPRPRPAVGDYVITPSGKVGVVRSVHHNGLVYLAYTGRDAKHGDVSLNFRYLRPPNARELFAAGLA
jgi:hypothetical protein